MRALPKLVMIVSLLLLGPGLLAATQLTRRTPGEIRGGDPAIPLHFHATWAGGGAQAFVVRCGNTRIRLRVGWEPRWFRIESDGPGLTDDDVAAIRGALAALGAPRSSLEDGLARALNLLASWPPNLPIRGSLRDGLLEAANGRWRVEGSTADIQDICGKMNRLHTGTYPVNLIPRGFEALVGPYPWADGGCMGRCGAGCPGDGPPNNTVFAFGQDCFDHDACVGDQGLTDLDCNLIFPAAVDDFLYGPSCQKDNVDLAVNGGDGPVTLPAGEPIELRVSLVGVPAGLVVDYWLYVQTAAGLYWLDGSGSWVSGAPAPARIGPLVQVFDRVVYQGPPPAGMPPGPATFYVSVDLAPDGAFTGRQFEDAVDVTVVATP
ncbi:MAG: hypothetical protein PVF68_11400 [Acidobacteriota bacterium]|jgi:hypothetical protein